MARVFLNQQFGSGGSAEVDSIGLITPTLTTSWQRFSTTVTVPSIAGKTVGTGSSLWALFQLGNTATLGTLQFWGVQVEASNTATAFQTATGTLQGELAACQRYYWRTVATDAANAVFGQGMSKSATTATIPINNPVTMRVKATSLDYANLEITDLVNYSLAVAGGGLTFLNTNSFGTEVLVTNATGATQYRPAFLRASNNTAAYFGVSAEL
jgi:hypothetical protein